MKKSLLSKVCLVGMAAILFSCFQCEPYFESVLNIRNTSYEQIYFMAYKNGEPSSYTLKCGEDFNYWLEGETKSFLQPRGRLEQVPHHGKFSGVLLNRQADLNVAVPDLLSVNLTTHLNFLHRFGSLANTPCHLPVLPSSVPPDPLE